MILNVLIFSNGNVLSTMNGKHILKYSGDIRKLPQIVKSVTDKQYINGIKITDIVASFVIWDGSDDNSVHVSKEIPKEHLTQFSKFIKQR